METINNKYQWQYDEMRFCGVKFDKEEFAQKYDKHHQKFRDYKKETDELIQLLAPGSQATVIDMGCGTGAFAIHAASYFRKIYAVDVSQAMIKCTIKKAQQANIDNIEFYHGGFLTYTHTDEPADAVVSKLALHHLPDFWKQIALRRLAKIIKPGGKLFLFDVVFSFDYRQYESYIPEYIQLMTERLGNEMKQEIDTHFRQEYSTFDWIMEGMLEKAGFEINKADYKEGFFATYLCTKKEK